MGAVAEAVVDVVSDVVETVGDAVSDVGREVGRAAENVVREVGQAAETVGREVGKAAEDVGKAIETVGQTIAENPITAIAIVAVAVAAPYALPAATAALGTTAGAIAVGAASGAIVGAAGAIDRGSSILEPALKGALIGGATAGLAPGLTEGLSAIGVPSSIATTVGSGLAGAAGGAGMAAMSGGDVGLAALSGGLGSAVGAGTQIGTGSRLAGTLAGTATAGLSAGLGGRETAARTILAGLQGVIASTISQQLQPKLQQTNQKFSSAQDSIRSQYNSTNAEYNRLYAEANSLQGQLEQTRQRLLAIQSMQNPTQQDVDEFDGLYAKYQNQQKQIDNYNSRLTSLAGQANNLTSQYASLDGAYQNEISSLENQAKQQYAALERQAGLLPGELAKEDPITQALVKEYLSAQAGGLPKSLGQFASAQGTTDVPMITLAGQTIDDGDAITVDDPLYKGNKLNLQQAMMRGEALDNMYKEALQQNNATKLELLDQARFENAKIVTTLWNTVVGQGDSGQYAALLGTPSAGGQVAGGSLSMSSGIMNVDLPFVPIAYVYNKSNPEQVSVMADNGVTYSLVNVDGRNLLQDNTTNQFVVELTKNQVNDIRNESKASVEQAQQKEKEAELKPSQTTGGGGGGGGGGGNEGSEGTQGKNILDDIIRIESQISAAGSAPIGTYTSPDISAARDSGRVLGTSQSVQTGTSRPGGGGGLGDLFAQGFGTTEFGRGEGVGAGQGAGTGTGSGGGRGSGTGKGIGSGEGDGSGTGSGTGRGSGKGSGTGSGEGAGAGGLASMMIGGISPGGVGQRGGGVLYPAVGTSALAQALNIVPDLGGGGGDVDPSRSLNKKKLVWNIESLKLKDALGA